ncbi:MAG: AAA family ATPase [Leptolyngbyaceae cyanobacterium]
MKNYIKKVKVTGLYKKFDIEQEFHKGINVIYGVNGEFKTTFIHILTNFMNKDFERFFDIDFDRISIHFENGDFYYLRQYKDTDRLELKRNGERRGLFFSRENENLPAEALDLSRVAYFPTFRSIIEAWFAYESRDLDNTKTSVKQVKRDISEFLREIFGGFVPNINFLSLPEIISKVGESILDSGKTAIQTDQNLIGKMASKISDMLIFSGGNVSMSDPMAQYSLTQIIAEIDMFLSHINSLFNEVNITPVGPYLDLPRTIEEKVKSTKEKIESIKGKIKSDKEKAESKSLDSEVVEREECKVIARLLKIYKEILEKELEEVSILFLRFNIYFDSLNKFLRGKKILIKSKYSDSFVPEICLSYEDEEMVNDFKNFLENKEFLEDKGFLEGEKESDLMATEFKGLSSGERQIASLLYAAHISSEEVILIDEPEISLHTQWQEILLSELQLQTGDKQIIVCTHSPSIGADYLDEVQTMNVSKTQREENSDDMVNDNRETSKEEDTADYKEAEYYEEEYAEQE